MVSRQSGPRKTTSRAGSLQERKMADVGIASRPRLTLHCICTLKDSSASSRGWAWRLDGVARTTRTCLGVLERSLWRRTHAGRRTQEEAMRRIATKTKYFGKRDRCCWQIPWVWCCPSPEHVCATSVSKRDASTDTVSHAGSCSVARAQRVRKASSSHIRSFQLVVKGPMRYAALAPKSTSKRAMFFAQRKSQILTTRRAPNATRLPISAASCSVRHDRRCRRRK